MKANYEDFNKEFEKIKNLNFEISNIYDVTTLIIDTLEDNIFNGYYMFRYILEKNINKEIPKTIEFHEFIFKVIGKIVDVTDSKTAFSILFSLNESSQFLITYIFISPCNENNFLFQFIKVLISEKQYDLELEIINLVKDSKIRLNKSIFDFYLFLEKLLLFHIESKNYNSLCNKEQAVVDYIINLAKNKKFENKLKQIIVKSNL